MHLSRRARITITIATVGLFILWEIPAARRFATVAITAITGFDFVYERYRDPTWIRELVGMLANPPPGLTLTVMAIGLTVIYWSARPKEKRMTVPALGMLLCSIGFVGCGFWYLYNHYYSSPVVEAPNPLQSQLDTAQQMLRDRERERDEARSKLFVLTHPAPAPVPKQLRYLPEDAQEITKLLREFRNKLAENTRDSTSLPGSFRGVPLSRRDPDFLHGKPPEPDSKMAAKAMKEKIVAVKEWVERCNTATPNFSGYNAYAEDLTPLVGGLWISDEGDRNLFSDFLATLDLIGRDDHLVGPAEVSILETYNGRMRTFINSFYEKVRKRIDQIDATILRIREDVSR